MTKNEQDYSIDGTTDSSTAPTYRGAVYAERQKFGKSPRELIQLLHPHGIDINDLHNIEVFGLDFTIAENRAFDALQQLLNQTDYQGNEHSSEVKSEGYQGDYRLPQLSFTWSQYFAAYGLPLRNGKYQGEGRQRALDAIKSLAQTQRLIIFRRRRNEDKKKTNTPSYDLVRQTGPIIRIVETFRGLKEEMSAKIIAGEDISPRTTRVLVEFGPLFVDGIETFFLNKSPTLYEEISSFYEGRRFSPAVVLFCQWLRTWNRPTVSISKEKLAWALRLDRLITTRKQHQLDLQLIECCRVAKAIGYLQDYKVIQLIKFWL